MQDATYDWDGFRARTNVTDPSGVNAAFDAGDTAKDTNWSQAVDTLFRFRAVVKQTNSNADTEIDTEFLLQYNNTGGGWNTVGAVGADVEDVQYATPTGFTDGDNTTQVIGSGTFVTGDGMAVAGASDTVSFTASSLTETELEFALEIVGANVANDNTIEFRLLWSDNDESPPATTMSATTAPTVTVVKVSTKNPTHLLLLGAG